MADTSLFKRLNRLFSSDVIIRNIGGTQIKVADVNHIQATGKYQTNALLDRFSRLYIYNNKNIFNPNLNYQTLRIQLYTDYEAMDTDPILASALDIIADETTLRNDVGEVLSIKSSDENIQRILYNLFYDVLNIEFNLWSWVRNTCKYGDFFLKLEIAEEFGIYNVLPYTVYHMTRQEGMDHENPTKVTFQLDPDGLASSQDPNYLPKDNSRIIQFDNYEVAHFRLLADTNYLPYGRSFLEPARKIHKQLCLPEGTKIWTEGGGYKTIENIQKGDRVFSFDYENNKVVPGEVKAQVFTGEKEIYKIKTAHRTLRASGEHPVMVRGGSYKRADEITVEDYIVLGNTETLNQNNLPNFEIDKGDILVEKVRSIEKENEIAKVYDIEVDNELHNFIAEGVVVHNCLMEDAMLIHRIMRAPEKRTFFINVGQIPPHEVEQFMQKTINNMKKTPYIDPKTGDYNLRFNMMNMMEDFYIPVRGGDATTRIETAKGLEYNGIEDINYLREKLFAALKIPKAYFGFEGELSGKSVLAAEDIRFARTIDRIQRIMESELTKVALIHLYAQGFKGASLTNFEIRLNNPSIIFEQEKVALLKEKIDLANQMKDSKLFSSDYIYSTLFNLSEDQYMEMRDLVIEDQKRLFRMTQIENEGNDPTKSLKAYGTPHVLATMYGRRGAATDDKGTVLGEVPTGYEDHPLPFQAAALDKKNPEGRPRTHASHFGTNDGLGGRDPLGVHGMKGGFPSDNENVMETKSNTNSITRSVYERNKEILKELPQGRRLMLFEKKKEIESPLLDEKQIKDLDN